MKSPEEDAMRKLIKDMIQPQTNEDKTFPVAKTGIAKIFEQGVPEINPVAKSGPLGELYADQISNQLGIKVTPPDKSDRTENETKEFIPGYGYNEGEVIVKAWRRLPEHTEWRISVNFGDGGFEVDPGIYSETDKAKVLAILEKHQRQIAQAIEFIKEEF